MHEDIIRQRFEEYYCDEYNMERLERRGNGFYISPLAKREWKTWKTAYASMREIEEQPVRRSIPVEELTDAELALMEKQVSEMPEEKPACGHGYRQ